MSKLFRIFGKKDINHAKVGSVVIKFLSAFFAFLNGVLLARYLTVEGFGYYVIVFSTMILLLVPVTLGIPHLLTRYISKYEVHQNYAAIKGLMRKANIYVFRSLLVIFSIATILYFVWWRNYNEIIVESILYGFILLPILGFGALRNSALRGMKLVILAELPDTLLRNLVFTICILGGVFSGFELTVKTAIIFQIFASAIGFLVGYIFLQKKLWPKLKSVQPEYHTKEWTKQTVPFTINSGVQVVKTKSVNYILLIFGSVESVALFEVAMRGASLVSFVLDALNMAIAPFVSAAFEKNNIDGVQKIVKKTSRIIFLVSLPVALLFIFGGRTLLEMLFGDKYGDAYIPLFVLCVGQLISALIGSVGLLLSMTGHQKVFANSNIVAMFTLVIGSIPLVILYDTVGVALVVSLVLIIQNVVLFNFVKRTLGVNTTVF